MKIPKIIHQVYEGPEGPSKIMLEIAKSWKEHNPTWEYLLWRKADMDKLVLLFPEFSGLYYRFQYNVQRWDTIRYMILYEYGGVYVDLDYECLCPVDAILSEKKCYLGLEPHADLHRMDFLVGNAFLASIPCHTFWKDVMSEVEDSYFSGRNDFLLENPRTEFRFVLETTGPSMLTRAFKQVGCKYKDEIGLLPTELIAPLEKDEVKELKRGNITKEMEDKVEKAYAIHYFFGSWI